MARLSGKTAIVTGGGFGFGAGIVRKFVAEGARVMIADINGERRRSAGATELGAEGRRRWMSARPTASSSWRRRR